MMILPPVTRMVVGDNLGQFRGSYQKIVIVTVSVTPSGYDEFTDSALVVPDSTNGTGLVPSFSLKQIYCRWTVIDLPALNPYQGIPPGVESGDYLIWIGKRDYPMMLACQEQAYSYIEIGDLTFKLQGYCPDGLGQSHDSRFIARKYQPVFTRP